MFSSVVLERRSPYKTNNSFSHFKSVETRGISLCSVELIKRSYLPIGLLIVLVTGALLFSGCTKPTLGEAQIVVYERGEKTIIDSKSPYFEELQAACEEMLTSAEQLFSSAALMEKLFSPSELMHNRPDLEELKNKEWAVELTYNEPIEVSIVLGLGPTAALSRPIKISQFLIPLTGKWSQVEAVGVSIESFDEGEQNYICLFLFPEIVYGEDRWEGLIGTKTDVQKIKDILTRFDINLP